MLWDRSGHPRFFLPAAKVHDGSCHDVIHVGTNAGTLTFLALVISFLYLKHPNYLTDHSNSPKNSSFQKTSNFRTLKSSKKSTEPSGPLIPLSLTVKKLQNKKKPKFLPN